MDEFNEKNKTGGGTSQRPSGGESVEDVLAALRRAHSASVPQTARKDPAGAANAAGAPSARPYVRQAAQPQPPANRQGSSAQTRVFPSAQQSGQQRQPQNQTQTPPRTNASRSDASRSDVSRSDAPRPAGGQPAVPVRRAGNGQLPPSAAANPAEARTDGSHPVVPRPAGTVPVQRPVQTARPQTPPASVRVPSSAVRPGTSPASGPVQRPGPAPAAPRSSVTEVRRAPDAPSRPASFDAAAGPLRGMAASGLSGNAHSVVSAPQSGSSAHSFSVEHSAAVPVKRPNGAAQPRAGTGSSTAPKSPAGRPVSAPRTTAGSPGKPAAPGTGTRAQGVQPKPAPRTSSPASTRPVSRPAPRPAAPGTPVKKTANAAKNYRKIEKYKKQRREGSAVGSLFKAFLYIIFVIAVSGILASIAITVGNDVFAFVKDDSELEISIGQGITTEQLGELLKENKVIKYPWAFKLYTSLRTHDNVNYVEGTYTVSPSMNYDVLRQTFQDLTGERTVVQVTIPEGYTADQIINLMVEKGIGTKDGYIDVIQNYDYDFWFLDELTPSPDRKYRLEGYLYPDTYYFYSDSTEATVIYKLLCRFDELFSDKLIERCRELGWTVDDALKLASMVQMEAKWETDYPDVASVFINRLNNPYSETYGLLQSDATIQYALFERETDPTLVDTTYDTPYNTYIYKGLPPGPITNPTQTAISYALWPSTTNYYYFVSKPDGWTLFASTLAEHQANIEEVARLGAQ